MRKACHAMAVALFLGIDLIGNGIPPPDSAGHNIRAYIITFRALAVVAGTPTLRRLF